MGGQFGPLNYSVSEELIVIRVQNEVPDPEIFKLTPALKSEKLPVKSKPTVISLTNQQHCILGHFQKHRPDLRVKTTTKLAKTKRVPRKEEFTWKT